MLTAVLVAAIASASAEPAAKPAPKPRMLVLDVAARGVDANAAHIVSGLIAGELGHYTSFEVLSGEDVRQALALEGTKRELDCSGDAGCLAELAGALSAELVVFGDLGRLDNVYVLNLNLLDTKTMKAAGRANVVAGEISAYASTLHAPVRAMLAGRFPEAAAAEPGLPWGTIAAVGGGVTLAAGLVLTGIGLLPFARYSAAAGDLKSATDDKARNTAVAAGLAAQADQDHWGAPLLGTGLVVVGVGAVVAGTGAALLATE